MAENILIADDNELPPPANNKIVIADDDDLPPALNEKKKPSPNGGTPLQPGTKATSLSKSTYQSVSVNPKNNPIPLTKSGSISGVPDFSGIVKDAVTPKVNPSNKVLPGIGKSLISETPDLSAPKIQSDNLNPQPSDLAQAQISGLKSREELDADKNSLQLADYLEKSGKSLKDFDPVDFKKHINTINGETEETPFIGKAMAAYKSDLDAYGKAGAIINRNIDVAKADIDSKLGPGTFGKYQKLMQDYQSQFKFKEPLIKKIDGDISTITQQLTDLQQKAKSAKNPVVYGQIKQQYGALYSQAEQLQKQRDEAAGPLAQMEQELKQFSSTPEFQKLNDLYSAQQTLSEKQESLLDKHPDAKQTLQRWEDVQKFTDGVIRQQKLVNPAGAMALTLGGDVLKTITKTAKNLSAIPSIVEKATGTEGLVKHSPLVIFDAVTDAIHDVSAAADNEVNNLTPSNMDLPVSQHYKIVDGNKIFVDKNGNALFARDIDGYKLGDSAEKKAIEKYNANPEAKNIKTQDKKDWGVMLNEAVKFGLDIVGPLKGIGTGLTELGLAGSAAKGYANGTLTLMGYGLNDAYESAKQSAPNLTDQQASQYALGSQAAIGLMFSMLGGAKMKYITGDGENIFAKIRSAISKEKGLKLDASDIKAIDGGLSPYQVGQRKVLGLMKESLLQGGEMGVIMPTANALMNGVTNKLVGYKALGTDIDLKESFVNGGAPAMLVGAVTGFSGVNRSSIKNEAWSKITKDDATAKATLNFINQSTEDGLYTQEQADRLKQRISYTVKNLEPFAGTLDESSKKILANLYDHKFQLTEKAMSLTDDAAKKVMESQIKDIDNDIAETIKGNQDNLKSQIAVGIRDGISNFSEEQKNAEQAKTETNSNAVAGEELNISSGVSESNGNSGDIQQGVGETTMSDQTKIPKVEEEYKRLIEPQKPISEMNSEEIYELANQNKQALKKQDEEFSGKTELEKEEGGYYNVIDDVQDLRETSERINWIETSENAKELAENIRPIISKMDKENPSEYHLAILNAVKIRSQELGIDINDLVRNVIELEYSRQEDVTDAEFMSALILDKMIPKNTHNQDVQIEKQLTIPKAEVPKEESNTVEWSGDEIKPNTKSGIESTDNTNVSPEQVSPVSQMETTENPALKDVESTAKALSELPKETLRDYQYGVDMENFRESLSESDKKDWDELMSLEFDKNANKKRVTELRDKFKPLEQEWFSENDSNPQRIAEQYHENKINGTNPELVKAVEELLGKPTEKPKTETTSTVSSEVVSGSALKDVVRQESDAEKLNKEAGVDIYVARQDIDTNGGKYTLSQIKENGNTNTFLIEDAKGNEVGKAQLSANGNYLENIRIDEKHRRKGLASKVYDFIELRKGIELEPSPNKQSKEAKALWDKRNLQKSVSNKANGGLLAKALGESMSKTFADFRNKQQVLLELENKYFEQKGLSKEEFNKLSENEKSEIIKDAIKWKNDNPELVKAVEEALSNKKITNEEQPTNADITGKTTDAEPVITTDETSQKSEETKSTEESGEGQREKGEDAGGTGEEKGNVLSGIKKAENDKLRESLGLPKVELPKGVSRVEGMRQAKELVDSGEVNPLDIENKAISFKDEPHKLQASTQDNNVLNYRRHQLVQKKAELLKQKALLESGDMNKPETIQELAVVQQRIIDNLQEIDRNSLASDVVGKVFAGSGNARQVLLNSMGKIERDIERIKATYADEVPEDVRAKLEDLQARADEAHARLSALEEQFDTTKQEFEDEVKKAYERGKKEGIIKPAKTYTEKAKTAADTIRKLKTKPITLRDADGNEITLTQNNILPWNEMVELAASAVEKAGEAADRVSVAIDAAMGRLKDEEWYMNLSPKNRKAIEEQVGQQIEDLLSPTEKAPKLSIPQARIKEAMRMGIDNIKALVEEINKDYPDATPREVRDAITGYGTTKELNKDPENVALRRMKRIGRYISMLEDIENNERPSRSGLQRDVIDPDERKMLKEVREKLKKLKPTDEDISKKLKTAQDIIEARLQNEIDDIQREIDTGERAIKTKRDIPATEKMDELRALKAQKIAERDAKFATDKREDALQEIRDAAAEEDTKTITESMVKNNLIGDLVSAHITEGEPTESVYDSAFKKVKEILPDVTEREFREAFLKKGKFAPQQKTKTQLQKELADIKSQQSLIKRIDDLNNGIVTETKKQGEKSEAVKKLQKELADIKKKANNQFAELSADELRKKAEAVKRQIDKGEYIKPEVVKNKFESNPEWIKRNRELVNIKMELKKLEADAYEGNKSTFMKICDVFNNWTTRALFLGTYAYQVKLGVAAGMSVFSRPFEELAGGIYNTAFKGISKNAPIEGNTIQSLKSLPDFYKKALPFLNPIETLQSTKEILSTGQSKLDKEFDPFHKENFTFKGKSVKEVMKSLLTADHIPLIDALTTDPHMIMKDPIKRGAYEASYKNYMQWVADNMGPEYVNDPMVIETAKNASYLRAKSEIFMGGKVTEGGSKEAKGWNDKIKAYFTALQMNAIKKAKSESVTERMSANKDYALSTAWNFLVPIKKVPLNILSRVVKGNPIVLAKNILGAVKTNYEVNNKGLQLSTEESDAILRDLKKGTTGSVWWILGYLAAGSMVGGFYNPFDPDKNRKKEVKSGEILLGQEEDSWQNLVIHGGEHSSQIASLMLGATFHSTLRHYMEDEKEAFLYAMTMASVATTRATIDQNPLVGLGFDAADAFKSEHGAKRFGENVKGRFDIPKKVETINPVTYWSEKLHNHGKKKEKSKD